jgi:hypothetical protein
MKHSTTLARFLASAVLVLGSALHVQATTINWGTYFSVTSYLYDSSGTPLTDDFVFELGSFGTGFSPTETNMDQWQSNWKPFDRASAPLGNGFDSASGTVASTAVLETDFTTDNTDLSQLNTFAEGEQAYIWIYKDTFGNINPSPSFASGFQWALVTNNASDGTAADDWLFPQPSGHVVSTLEWRMEDATFSPFGGLNDTQYEGDYSSTPGAFVLQTHTAPIPEVGSSLLIGCAGLSFLLRRRRHT